MRHLMYSFLVFSSILFAECTERVYTGQQATGQYLGTGRGATCQIACGPKIGKVFVALNTTYEVQSVSCYNQTWYYGTWAFKCRNKLALGFVDQPMTCPEGQELNTTSCTCYLPPCPVNMHRDSNNTCVCDDGFNDVNGTCQPAPEPCTLEDTNFSHTDAKELFRWTAGNDRNADCVDKNGTVQSKRTSCKIEYRCVKEQADDPRSCVWTGSYVMPKDGVFHEDIKIDGVDFELHYQSAYLDINTSLARGWTISAQARMQGDVLYLGSGTSYDVKDRVVYGIDVTTVSINGYEYLFDTSNRHVQTRSVYTKTPVYTFTYDIDNRLVSIADIYNQTTLLNYAITGELQSITAPNGQVTQLSIGTDLNEVRYGDNSYYTFTYDNHYLISKRDPNGNLYQYNYNANGQIISSINPQNVAINFAQSPVLDGTDNVITSALLNETKYKSFHLDANNMLRTEKTLPTGEVVVYNNSVDELSSSVERCGVTTTNLYTAKDPLTQQRSLIATTQTMPSTLSKTTNIDTAYTYDASSNLATKTRTNTTNTKVTTSLTDYATQEVSVTSPEGRVQTVKLDPLMRHVTQSSYADLTPTSYTYNNVGQLLQSTQGTRITSNTYDTSGNLITHTDESGNITSYAYDARNRLLSITNAQNQVTSFSYDANSNETRLTTPTPANFDSAFNTIDLKVSMTSPLGYTTNYTYDEEKHLTQMTRSSGKVITHSYLNGQHVTMQTPEGSYSYSYDCGDKISRIQKGTTESIDYGYDGELLTSMAYTGELNQVINYTYNSDFLADSIAYAGTTDTLSYDNDGILVQSGAFSIARNSTNSLPTTVSDTVFTQNRIFNTYGELDTETNTVNANSIFSYEITDRYANGQIKTKVETLDGVVTTYDYTYDSVNRLIEVKENNVITENYEYDQNGNRVKGTSIRNNMIDITTSYTIEDQIELTGGFTYTYDTDGYLTSKTDGNATTSYVYGSLGELKQVTLPSGDIITYKHNANNQRIAKLINGAVVEKYLWKDLTTLLATFDANGNLDKRLNYADARTPNSYTDVSGTYYLAYDQVGSLKAVTDSTGNIVKELSYDSFGNILSDSNPSMNLPFGFAGGLYDSDTGLIRFGYRDFDPVTGKWTAKDPIGFDGGDTSLYGYVLNDPINLVDPEGLKTFGFSFNFSYGSGGIGVSHGLNFVWDDKGNFQAQWINAIGGYAGIGFGLTADFEKSDAECVDKLNGNGYQTGGSGGKRAIAEAGGFGGPGYTGQYFGVGLGGGLTPVGFGFYKTTTTPISFPKIEVDDLLLKGI